MTEPAWLTRARRNLGVKETPGQKSTLSILRYRVMAKIVIGGDDGAVPWCAIFWNAMHEVVGIKGTRSAMARSFSRWGQDCGLAHIPLGATVVLSSNRGPASGHVGGAVALSKTHVWLLGANQGDAVSIAPFLRSRIVAVRWPNGLLIPAGMSDTKGASAEREVSDA